MTARIIVFAALVSAMLVLAGTAQAATTSADRYTAVPRPTSGVFTHQVNAEPGGERLQNEYSSTFLDSVVDGISGWSLTTELEDDPASWSTYYGVNDNVLGFACITRVDPTDWCYHRVFLGPTPTNTFINWFNYHQQPTYWDAAVAIMTVAHEANHYKLFSSDEGRVNACALQQFPEVVDTYFGYHPTTTSTVPVRKAVWTKKWAWARRHDKRVRVRKRVRRVITVYVQRTVPNPAYTNLMSAAQAFYNAQPAPYNTGVCY